MRILPLPLRSDPRLPRDVGLTLAHWRRTGEPGEPLVRCSQSCDFRDSRIANVATHLRERTEMALRAARREIK